MINTNTHFFWKGISIFVFSLLFSACSFSSKEEASPEVTEKISSEIFVIQPEEKEDPLRALFTPKDGNNLSANYLTDSLSPYDGEISFNMELCAAIAPPTPESGVIKVNYSQNVSFHQSKDDILNELNPVFGHAVRNGQINWTWNANESLYTFLVTPGTEGFWNCYFEYETQFFQDFLKKRIFPWGEQFRRTNFSPALLSASLSPFTPLSGEAVNRGDAIPFLALDIVNEGGEPVFLKKLTIGEQLGDSPLDTLRVSATDNNIDYTIPTAFSGEYASLDFSGNPPLRSEEEKHIIISAKVDILQTALGDEDASYAFYIPSSNDITAVNRLGESIPVEGIFPLEGNLQTIILPEGENPTECTTEYAPICGQKDVQCIQEPCNPIEQTYGNLCELERDEADFLYEGECSSPPEFAYFEMSDGVNTFIVEVSDPLKIAFARSILRGEETERTHISGTYIRGDVPYNSDWSYFLEPSTIDFFENSVEACDASITWLSDENNNLSDNYWCPWSSVLVKELHNDSEENLLGDFNADGCVDGDIDFAIFHTAFGSSEGDPEYLPEADFIADGVINSSDFNDFGTHVGTGSCANIPLSLPGDFNENGCIDDEDHVTFNGFPRNEEGYVAEGDFDNNGVINWRDGAIFEYFTEENTCSNTELHVQLDPQTSDSLILTAGTGKTNTDTYASVGVFQFEAVNDILLVENMTASVEALNIVSGYSSDLALDALSLFYYEDGTAVLTQNGVPAVSSRSFESTQSDFLAGFDHNHDGITDTVGLKVANILFENLNLIIQPGPENAVSVETRAAINFMNFDSSATSRSNMQFRIALQFNPLSTKNDSISRVRGLSDPDTFLGPRDIFVEQHSGGSISVPKDPQRTKPGNIMYVYNEKVIVEKSASQNTALSGGGSTNELMKFDVKVSENSGNNPFLKTIYTEIGVESTDLSLGTPELFNGDGAKIAEGENIEGDIFKFEVGLDAAGAPLADLPSDINLIEEKQYDPIDVNETYVIKSVLNGTVGDNDRVITTIFVNNAEPRDSADTAGIIWRDTGASGTGEDGTDVHWINLRPADTASTKIENILQ